MATKLPSSAPSWPTIATSIAIVTFGISTHLLHPHKGSALKTDIAMVYKELDQVNRKYEVLSSLVGKMREDLGEIRGKTIKDGASSSEGTAFSMND